MQQRCPAAFGGCLLQGLFQVAAQMSDQWSSSFSPLGPESQLVLLEKMIANQLIAFKGRNYLSEKFQSGF